MSSVEMAAILSRPQCVNQSLASFGFLCGCLPHLGQKGLVLVSSLFPVLGWYDIMASAFDIFVWDKKPATFLLMSC